MEFWTFWVITAMTVVGTVLALLVARENYLSSTRLMSMIPKRALLRSSRELLAGTMLLALSVSASLFLLAHERDRRTELEQELKQLRASADEVQAALRSDETPVAETRVIEEAPMVPVAIQDREDFALVEAAPEPAPGAEPPSSADALRVAAPSLNLRMAPNGAVIRSLGRGHRVQLMGERVVHNKRWAHVRSLEMNAEGWVSRSAITASNSRG